MLQTAPCNRSIQNLLSGTETLPAQPHRASDRRLPLRSDQGGHLAPVCRTAFCWETLWLGQAAVRRKRPASMDGRKLTPRTCAGARGCKTHIVLGSGVWGTTPTIASSRFVPDTMGVCACCHQRITRWFQANPCWIPKLEAPRVSTLGCMLPCQLAAGSRNVEGTW